MTTEELAFMKWLGEMDSQNVTNGLLMEAFHAGWKAYTSMLSETPAKDEG